MRMNEEMACETRFMRAMKSIIADAANLTCVLTFRARTDIRGFGYGSSVPLSLGIVDYILRCGSLFCFLSSLPFFLLNLALQIIHLRHTRVHNLSKDG